MNEDIVEALNAERYSPVNHRLWWPTPPLAPRPVDRQPMPDLDDSEVTCARRRREAIADAKDEISQPSKAIRPSRRERIDPQDKRIPIAILADGDGDSDRLKGVG